MNKIHPLIRVGGPILGVLILMYVINFAVDTFRADLKTARDAEREATLAAVDAAQELEAEEAATAEAQAQAEAEAQSEDAQEEAPSESVFFLQPTTNAIVPPTFTVKMGAVGVEVEPSGDIVPGSGHMHILVDTDFIAAGEVIPTDEQHLHYGDASLEAELTLTPGEHTLHLQFADGAHIALEGDQYRDQIDVVVSAESQASGGETSSSQQLSQETIDLAIAAMTTTGCNSCHITTGLPEVDAAILGPDQTNLGAIAATRREGYTAEEYLRESILEPSVFLVEECPLGQCLQVMPENYGDLLSEEEVDAIVAYLLSLKTDE